jgi:hypothetical protein
MKETEKGRDQRTREVFLTVYRIYGVDENGERTREEEKERRWFLAPSGNRPFFFVYICKREAEEEIPCASVCEYSGDAYYTRVKQTEKRRGSDGDSSASRLRS